MEREWVEVLNRRGSNKGRGREEESGDRGRWVREGRVNEGKRRRDGENVLRDEFVYKKKKKIECIKDFDDRKYNTKIKWGRDGKGERIQNNSG